MTSKSLPSSFSQNKSTVFHNSSTASQIQTIEDSDINCCEDQIQSICSLYFSSSNVNDLPSPLEKASWLNQVNSVNTSSSGTCSDKSWMPHRWSTVSGSLIARRKNRKSTASRLWTNRQKRRTFPPSSNILKREREKFALLPPMNKKHHRRQSLQDILSTFYKYNNASIRRGSHIGAASDVDSTPTSSSSMSNKLARILKKTGKQPLKGPTLANTEYTEQESKAAMMMMPIFQPSATFSCISSTPTSPLLQFPTPPERFSAYYMNSQGKSGKVDYKSKMEASHDMTNAMQHGAISLHHVPNENNNSNESQHREYNKQLLLGASLFLFGFLFFPFWWIGTWLHFRKRKQSNSNGIYCENELISVRTLAYLNCIFSCFSFVLVAIILSLVIWMVNS